MYFLEEFIHQASTAAAATGLQKSWTEFVEHFGGHAYRIVPAPARLAKHLYSTLKTTYTFLPRWSLPAAPVTRTPDTVLDIAHKTPLGWREHYDKHRLYRHDPVLAMELIDRGPFTRKEALAQFRNSKAESVVGQARDFNLHDGMSMSHWMGPEKVVATTVYMDTKDIARNDHMKLRLKAASIIFCARYQEFHVDRDDEDKPVPRLTPRELDVLHWMALGNTKQEIAAILGVSTSSIKRHCESTFEKLGVNNMAGAVARAMSYGLINI